MLEDISFFLLKSASIFINYAKSLQSQLTTIDYESNLIFYINLTVVNFLTIY